MRRTIVVLAVAVVLVMSMATAAFAGKGQDFKDCFDSNYGQSGLNYGQAKKSPPHPLAPYGLPGVLEAHGPDAGALSLCVSD